MDEWERFEDLMESDQSDPEIQYQLGLCFLHGEGTEADGQAAERWFRRAAEQGHEGARACLASAQAPEQTRCLPPLSEATLADWCGAAEEGDAEAQYEAALFFLSQWKGAGGAADAERYLSMAVEQGHPRACLALAERRLDAGRAAEAVELLRNAADCGLVEAMSILGRCCGLGTGTEPDPREAEAWFVRAAELGGGEEKLALALRYKHGDLVDVSPGRALNWLRQAAAAGAQDAEARFYAEENAQRERAAKLERAVAEAQAGDPEAQYRLACAYGSGEGVPQDMEQAAAWHRRAAELGMDRSQYALGTMYREGRGVAKDPVQAAFWLRKAAEQGLAEAQHDYADCLYNGVGASMDRKAAFEWYMKAAQAGDMKSQHQVGMYYHLGLGSIPRDPAKACEWYKRAAEQGFPYSMGNLGALYAAGAGVPKDPVQAAMWHRRAAELGSKVSQQSLGVFYETGQGVEKDPASAVFWFRKAAEQGLADAQFKMGWYSANGLGGMAKDPAQAARWYKKAADQGHAAALNNLGVLYETGRGVEKDIQTAVSLYKKAADKKVPSAMAALALYYEAGSYGFPKNPQEAVRLYTLSAQGGIVRSMYRLGLCYEKGIGVQADLNQAAAWYHKAGEKGHAEAQYCLGMLYKRLNGNIFNRMPREAREWLQKAAAQGHAGAKRELGL